MHQLQTGNLRARRHARGAYGALASTVIYLIYLPGAVLATSQRVFLRVLLERYQKEGVRRPGLWVSCGDCRGAQVYLAGRWHACRGERPRYPQLHALGRAGP